MITTDSAHIRKSITRFRRLALLSAASIAILNAWMVYRITSALDHGSANKIRTAGSQSMLSQRIRSDANEIETAVRYETWDKLAPLLEDLSASTEQLRDAHDQLLGGRRDAKDYFSQGTTEEIDLIASIRAPYQQLISASAELQKLTKNTILRAPYLDQQTHTRILASTNEIAQAQEIFFPRMQTMVDLFERESRYEVSTSINHAKIGMVILLCVLGATILFVIEPTILIIRRQLRDLDRATRHAKRADAVRWRLLTNMGHEFRTPMNAIMGFAELLKEESLSEAERSRLSKSIYDSSTQLTYLIETMLDMSAIESGQLRTVPTETNLHQTLNRIKVGLQARALAKGLELGLYIHESCPQQIKTDAKRLDQILHKLIDNAIKFTEAGRVDIGAKLIPTPEGQTLEITVADTGIGINDHDMGLIFNPFTQAEDNLTRNFGGAGLGLTIARDLARALGGDIVVESQPSVGSTFTLTIDPGDLTQNQAQSGPADQTNDASQSGAPDLTAIHSARILIVDDAKDNRMLLQHIFKRTGAHIEFAHDGQQAIHTVQNAVGSDNPFDIILMDMQMPVLDGYSATTQLREQGVATPIIALTAHALDGDREHCLQAGCDEYISKPVNRSQLLGACANLLRKNAAPNHPDPAAQQNPEKQVA